MKSWFIIDFGNSSDSDVNESKSKKLTNHNQLFFLHSTATAHCSHA